MRTTTRVAIEKFGNDPIRGIEVGVQFGIHAMELNGNLNFSELILCDIWEEYVSCGVKYDFCKAYDGVKTLFSEDKRVVVHKGACDSAGGMFDFAYIDGNHSLPAVLYDLRTMYPKMKAGGMLAGHDYSAVGSEVVLAVLTFAAEMKLTPKFGDLRSDDNVEFWFET